MEKKLATLNLMSPTPVHSLHLWGP